MLTDLEKKIIASIQEDMAITERPYLEISEKLGISEGKLLEALQSLCDRGIIRRFGTWCIFFHSPISYRLKNLWLLNENSTGVKRIFTHVAPHMQVCHT